MLRPILLCVDSDLDDQEALAKACDGAFTVKCVDTAEAAAKLLEGSTSFAAVVVGPKLKDMDGVDFLDQATAVAPQTRRVLIAADLDLKAIQHAINEDAICKLLIRPLDGPQVDAVLGSFLNDQSDQRRALVVDDDRAARLLLTRQLESLGMRCEVAVNGREALAQLNEAYASLQPFHLVCLDQNMPDVDGITTLRGLRMLQRRRGLPPKSTRVLMTTANTDRSVIVAAAEQQVDGYLIKPVSKQKLTAHVEKFGFLKSKLPTAAAS